METDFPQEPQNNSDIEQDLVVVRYKELRATVKYLIHLQVIPTCGFVPRVLYNCLNFT